jgi:hypothetical protein
VSGAYGMVGFGYNSSDHAAGDVLDSHGPSQRSTEGCCHAGETLEAVQRQSTDDERSCGNFVLRTACRNSVHCFI